MKHSHSLERLAAVHKVLEWRQRVISPEHEDIAPSPSLSTSDASVRPTAASSSTYQLDMSSTSVGTPVAVGDDSKSPAVHFQQISQTSVAVSANTVTPAAVTIPADKIVTTPSKPVDEEQASSFTSPENAGSMVSLASCVVNHLLILSVF